MGLWYTVEPKWADNTRLKPKWADNTQFKPKWVGNTLLSLSGLIIHGFCFHSKTDGNFAASWFCRYLRYHLRSHGYKPKPCWNHCLLFFCARYHLIYSVIFSAIIDVIVLFILLFVDVKSYLCVLIDLCICCVLIKVQPASFHQRKDTLKTA